MKKILAILSLLTVCCFAQQASSPYTIGTVEASGLFQGREKVGDNVLKCYRFSRPCKLDSTKSMISDTSKCGNDPSFALMEIHDNDNTTCLSRPAILQDSTNLYILAQMPNDWHDLVKYAKNYYQSDSLKQAQEWKLKMFGFTNADSVKLRKYGVVKGAFEGALFFDGEKTK